MITVESRVNPNSQKKPRSCIKLICLSLFVLIIGAIAGIWFLGSPKVHQEKNHLLYNSFDSSSPHKNLINNLDNTKLSIIVGKKSDGIVNFIQHYANKLTKNGKTVYLEEFSGNSSQIVSLARNVNEKAQELSGFYVHSGDWILISLNGDPIPKEKISEIQKKYPNGKIIVVTTSKKPKIKGFKVLTFPPLENKALEKSILKTFSINKNMLEIIRQHHDTHEELLNALEIQSFSAQQILKNEYVSLEGVDQEGAALLKKLCKSGAVKAKKNEKQPERLAKYGAIFVKNTYLWEETDDIFNYELFTGINCKNIVASEDQLKAYKQVQEKEAAEKKAKEEKEALKKGKGDPLLKKPKKGGKKFKML